MFSSIFVGILSSSRSDVFSTVAMTIFAPYFAGAAWKTSAGSIHATLVCPRAKPESTL
jgi:hypothetical protein